MADHVVPSIPREVKKAFLELSGGAEYLSGDGVQKFFQHHQREEHFLSEAEAEVLIEAENEKLKHPAEKRKEGDDSVARAPIARGKHKIAGLFQSMRRPHLSKAEKKEARSQLSLEGFFHMLMDPSNTGPIRDKVECDMTRPLSHYFIYTSHNTYLDGNQLTSASSEEPIIAALRRGVRVVELDLWPASDSKGDVSVTHGNTLVSPVSFRSCIAAIRENAFATSDYPVIITLEDHLTPDLQSVVALQLHEVLGDALYVPPADDLELDQFPSPEALKGRILISTKPPKPPQEVPDDPGQVEGDRDSLSRGAAGGGAKKGVVGRNVDPECEEEDNDDDDEEDEGEGRGGGSGSGGGIKSKLKNFLHIGKKDKAKSPTAAAKARGGGGAAGGFLPPVQPSAAASSAVTELGAAAGTSGGAGVGLPQIGEALAPVPETASTAAGTPSLPSAPTPIHPTTTTTTAIINNNNNGNSDSGMGQDTRLLASNPGVAEGEEAREEARKQSARAPEYRQLIAIRGGKVTGESVEAALLAPGSVKRVSLNETQLTALAKTCPRNLVKFTQRNLLRIFPKGFRITSSNYDPMLGWAHGAQMVAVNMQSHGRPLSLQDGFFLGNGGCGYIQKPDFFFSGPPPPAAGPGAAPGAGPDAELEGVFNPGRPLPPKLVLKVRVLLATGWLERFGPKCFDAFSPPDFYIKLGISGVLGDKEKRKAPVRMDQWNPSWEELSFDFHLSVPEIAVLRFEVHEYDKMDKDEFAGQVVLPVRFLKPGFRCLALNDKKDLPLDGPRLLCKFELEPVVSM